MRSAQVMSLPYSTSEHCSIIFFNWYMRLSHSHIFQYCAVCIVNIKTGCIARIQRDQVAEYVNIIGFPLRNRKLNFLHSLIKLRKHEQSTVLHRSFKVFFLTTVLWPSYKQTIILSGFKVELSQTMPWSNICRAIKPTINIPHIAEWSHFKKKGQIPPPPTPPVL